MSLPHAILGFLKYGPRTGYDLKRMFEASVHHFWSAQQSQIYQTLTTLEKRGWASVDLVRQDDRPNRKEYNITEAGRAELRRWLGQPRPEPPTRSPFLVQLFFSGELTDDEVLAVLEEKAQELRGTLELYESGSVTRPTFSKEMPKREQFFWYLTLDCGIESVRFTLRWLESVIARLHRKEYEKGMDGAFTKRSEE
jgi:PadR family transcriptional regulator AphA